MSKEIMKKIIDKLPEDRIEILFENGELCKALVNSEGFKEIQILSDIYSYIRPFELAKIEFESGMECSLNDSFYPVNYDNNIKEEYSFEDYLSEKYYTIEHFLFKDNEIDEIIYFYMDKLKFKEYKNYIQKPIEYDPFSDETE